MSTASSDHAEEPAPFPWGTAENSTDLHAVFDLVYNDLRKIASKELSRERDGHSLQPTALVHEVWLRLRDQIENVTDRNHAIALAVVAMRRTLTDHARARGRVKRRGGLDGRGRVTLLDSGLGAGGVDVGLCELVDALDQMEKQFARPARVFELRVFGSLPHAVIADLLGISEPTVRRDWKLAQLWMLRELLGEQGSAP